MEGMMIDEELLNYINLVHEFEAYITHLFLVKKWRVNKIAFRFHLPKNKVREILKTNILNS